MTNFTHGSYGVTANCDSLPKNIQAFTEILIEETCTIPEQKPDIEQINQIYIDVEVINKKLVKTPSGKSCDGKILTGFKVLVEGVIRQKIVYTANVPSQSVHSTECEKMFSTFIVIPKMSKKFCKTLVEEIKIETNIEEVCSRLIDNRTIQKTIMIFICADSCLFDKNKNDCIIDNTKHRNTKKYFHPVFGWCHSSKNIQNIDIINNNSDC